MKNPLKFNIPLFRIILQWINRATGYVGEFGEVHLEPEKWRLIGHDAETPGGLPIKTDVEDVLRIAKVAKTNDYNDLDNLPPVVQGTIISFIATDTPTIDNYNTLYAPTFGEYPDIKLYTIDESENRIARSEQPYFILDVDGLIESISFGVLADGPQNGFIKIQ